MQVDPIENRIFDLMGGGAQIFVKSFDGLACIYKNTVIECQVSGINCLNAKFDFFCDDLHLQIIASISPKSICRKFISPVGYFFYNNYTTSYVDLLSKAHIPSVSTAWQQSAVIEVYKALDSLSPKYM